MSDPVYTGYAAQRLKVSRRTIGRYIKHGLIRATWVGRRWLIDSDSIEAVLRLGTPKMNSKSPSTT